MCRRSQTILQERLSAASDLGDGEWSVAAYDALEPRPHNVGGLADPELVGQ
jgi:hypothetical protein